MAYDRNGGGSDRGLTFHNDMFHSLRLWNPNASHLTNVETMNCRRRRKESLIISSRKIFETPYVVSNKEWALVHGEPPRSNDRALGP